MALTATANQSVVNDCMSIIGMSNPFVHTQSFNRTNLQYSIRKKGSDKQTLQEMAEFIKQHQQETGIVYCLSKRDTETVAEELSKLLSESRLWKNKITFYHADISAHDKEIRQRAWSKGDIKVIW
jgi:superfamily II DNA helicase RecQ